LVVEVRHGLEMRVAAECRRQSLPTIQSVPYVDPIQANTVREADVVVRFGNQLSMSAALNAFAITFADRMPTKTN
jgi:hypothetical protein